MRKGPVTVMATEYGTRLDNQGVSRSATVDGVSDFVNLYDYDAEGNRIRRTEIATGEVIDTTGTTATAWSKCAREPVTKDQ